MAKSAQYTDEWFIEKGYTFDPQSKTYIPPKGDYENAIEKVRHSLKKPLSTKGCEVIGEVLVKQKVNNSPDFDIIKPCTEWFIPYQIPSKKNSRQVFVHPKTKKIVNIPSKAYKEYITVTKKYWEVFGEEFRNSVIKLDLKWPIKIEMTFTRKTNQIVDYFGPGESVFDLMTDFKWWPDDNRRYGKPFFGDMIVDKNNPGVRIKLILQ